jgi:16S rRNA (cytidine1402-2'-O)-methyltransferase
VTALALSGIPAGRFVFEGFLSTAKKSRFERLEALKAEQRTMIFYEAPHKLMRTLNDMLNAFGDRRISISRELTKLFEETLRFTLSEAVKHFEEKPPRGEFVLIIEGTQKSPVSVLRIDDAVSMARAHIESGLSVKDAVKIAAEQTGVSKNTLYNAVIKG